MYELFLYAEKNRAEIENHYRMIDQGMLKPLTQGKTVYEDYTNAYTYLTTRVAKKETF